MGAPGRAKRRRRLGLTARYLPVLLELELKQINRAWPGPVIQADLGGVDAAEFLVDVERFATQVVPPGVVALYDL